MLERVSKGRADRTLFLSDIHLGTKGCQAALLTSSVTTRRKPLSGRRHRRRLAAKSGWYWPQSHNDVAELLRQARKGVRLRYIPGNHDEFCATIMEPISVASKS
jgi:UDP-2,3-diacylglucosamine pyrophosphatase LpxH